LPVPHPAPPPTYTRSLHDALPICSEQKFVPKKVGDPDIILIQDRSGSMADGMPTKYEQVVGAVSMVIGQLEKAMAPVEWGLVMLDRKSTRLNSSHQIISYAVFCLK